VNVVEQALKIRRDMNTVSATLTDTEGIDLIGLFEPWTLKSYAVGDRFRYENKLYKVIQAHTSQEGWKPNELPALYLNLMPDNVIPEWKQPIGVHDAYSIGDKVIFEGKVYKSLTDSNTWSPIDYPQGWQVVGD
jgi:hypothetical protein